MDSTEVSYEDEEEEAAEVSQDGVLPTIEDAVATKTDAAEVDLET